MNGKIGYFFLSLFFLAATLVGAQAVETKWYDSEWNPVPSKVGAAYMRQTTTDSMSKLIVAMEYTAAGSLYRTGSFTSLMPEMRNGEFVWYYPSGRAKKKVNYKDNRVTSYTCWNQKGEQELGALVTIVGKNGESLWEPMKVDKEPSFVGGKEALEAYQKKNLTTPQVTYTDAIGGNVLVTFIVMEDGSLTDVTLVRGIHPDLDNEALRYAKNMPRWNPALVGQTPVKVQYLLFVPFTPVLGKIMYRRTGWSD